MVPGVAMHSELLIVSTHIRQEVWEYLGEEMADESAVAEVRCDDESPEAGVVVEKRMVVDEVCRVRAVQECF